MGQCGCWEHSVSSSWTTFGLRRKEGCNCSVRGEGEDEQKAEFMLSQIRHLLVDAHVRVSGGLAGISWLLPPLALVFCVPSQAQGLGLEGTAWQVLLELKR